MLKISNAIYERFVSPHKTSKTLSGKRTILTIAILKLAILS
jgi:hypothetical protein